MRWVNSLGTSHMGKPGTGRDFIFLYDYPDVSPAAVPVVIGIPAPVPPLAPATVPRVRVWPRPGRAWNPDPNATFGDALDAFGDMVEIGLLPIVNLVDPAAAETLARAF